MKNPTIAERLSQADTEELKRCEDSPVYFYNKYVRKEGQKELSEFELKAMADERDGSERAKAEYPMTPDQCYELEQSEDKEWNKFYKTLEEND